LPNCVEAAEWAKKSYQYLIFVEQREVGVAGLVVRAIAENLRDYIGGAKNFGAIGDDSCAFRGVRGVGVACFHSSAGFEDYVQAAFRESGDHRGHQGYAPFTGITFSRDAHDHETSSSETDG
jgi:hypothetical protein